MSAAGFTSTSSNARLRRSRLRACASPVVDQAVRARAAHLNEQAGELFEMELYLVLMYEGLAEDTRMATRVERAWRSPRAALRAWLSPVPSSTLLEEDVTRAVAQLHQQARALEVHLADTRPPRTSRRRTRRSDSFAAS